jgi:hypothetical protein
MTLGGPNTRNLSTRSPRIMSIQEEDPTPKRTKLLPTYSDLRELLWLPKLSLWGFVGAILLIAFLVGLIVMLLLRS